MREKDHTTESSMRVPEATIPSWKNFILSIIVLAASLLAIFCDLLGLLLYYDIFWCHSDIFGKSLGIAGLGATIFALGARLCGLAFFLLAFFCGFILLLIIARKKMWCLLTRRLTLFTLIILFLSLGYYSFMLPNVFTVRGIYGAWPAYTPAGLEQDMEQEMMQEVEKQRLLRENINRDIKIDGEPGDSCPCPTNVRETKTKDEAAKNEGEKPHE